MSGGDVPYQLRPNKFIDRELFMDLLSRIIPLRGSNRYVYVSMGGKHLVDHSSVYRKVGITNLFSFDLDDRVVLRQKFNRPIDRAVCDEMASGSLPGKVDEIMQMFPEVGNLVVWLDYTKPNERMGQLQELVQLASRLQPGDVLRITLNANIGTLDDTRNSGTWKELGFPSPKEYRADSLRQQLGDFVPAALDGIAEDDFAGVLCECVGLALSRAEVGDVRFRPVLLTTYKDGQRMMTATCVVVPENRNDDEVPGLGGWSFAPTSWKDLIKIEAPDLSLKEKMKIDECLSRAPVEVLGELGFWPMGTESASVEAIRSYQTLHRYYPSFHHIDA